jgi:hypothetical protein
MLRHHGDFDQLRVHILHYFWIEQKLRQCTFCLCITLTWNPDVRKEQPCSTYIEECNSTISNTGQAASQGMDVLMDTLLPHDHCQRLDSTKLVIRPEQVCACGLCSCDSGHDGNWVADLVWLMFDHILSTQRLCTRSKPIEHCCDCPWTIAVGEVSL